MTGLMEQQLEQVRRELLSKTAEQYRESKSAKTQLVNGLTRLREPCQQNSPALTPVSLVQQFGEMGCRKISSGGVNTHHTDGSGTARIAPCGCRPLTTKGKHYGRLLYQIQRYAASPR